MLKNGFVGKIFVAVFSLFLMATMITRADVIDHDQSSKDTNMLVPEMITVHIPMDHLSTVGFLIDHGITILDTRDSMIKAYVTPEQLEWLYTTGVEVQIPSEKPVDMGLREDFHNYAEMTAELQDIAALFPTIANLYELGYSVQGRTIWGLKITDNPDIEENEPEFRICGAHHGDELMSVEVPLLMCWHLVENYGSDPYITSLINDIEIWIIPMVNPDGREMVTRRNANAVDLNRDYGYVWGYSSPSPYSQPETQVIRAHALDNCFGLSLSFHCSGDIVNYVWNYKGQPVADETLVIQLSEAYGAYNDYWVVEGFDWYQVRGDTNDFSYGCRGDIDWTIEIQNSGITTAWNLNRDAILELMDAVDWGLTGVVTDAYTGEPIAATVWVEEVYWPCFTDPKVGDYHRILLPGTYTVYFRANGYEEQMHIVSVSGGAPTVLDVALVPGDDRYAYQVSWCYIHDPYSWPNNFQNNPTEVISALGPPDDIYASLGVGGNVALDMGENGTIYNKTGDDFIVFEGDDGTPEGYHVSVSDTGTWDGPWITVGSATGTASFDLEDVGVESARYIKIQDDHGGSAYENDPGFDLDAIQSLHAAQELQVLVEGFCFYPDMEPVNDVTMEICNLGTGQEWEAEVTDNYYSLELTPYLDVNTSDTLRLISKDTESSINVTEYVVTEGDMTRGSIRIDPILDIHYRDLHQFPMYTAAYSPFYTRNQMCGAAAGKMMLDYLHWNSTTHPGGPPWVFGQPWIIQNFTAHNPPPGWPAELDWYDDPEYISAYNMWLGMQWNAYEYGYNFWAHANASSDVILKTLCVMVDYPIPAAEGHPIHAPAAIPAYGDYSNWMVIRGIHTDADTWDPPTFPDFTIYGMWVNDPYPNSEIGENTYKTVDELLSTYFLPMNLLGDPYEDGKYVTVVEPPKGFDASQLSGVEVTYENQHDLFTAHDARVLQIARRVKTPSFFADTLIYNKAQAAIQTLAVYDERLSDFVDVDPIQLVMVKGSSSRYYLVVFGCDAGTIAMRLDATTGAFQELSTAEIQPDAYLKKLGIKEPGDMAYGVYVDGSPFYPWITTV